MTTTADLLRYLADSTDWLAHRQNEALDAYGELDAITRLVEDTIDTREPGAYAGPCDICGLDMYARPGKPIVKCRRCDVEYDLAPRRRKLLEKARTRLATAADCARALTAVGQPVTPERIRKWAEREQLTAAGRDRATGRPLYRIRDVLDILDRHPTTTRRTKTAS